MLRLSMTRCHCVAAVRWANKSVGWAEERGPMSVFERWRLLACWASFVGPNYGASLANPL